ncbi:MAG: hypothetical protein NTV31_12625 [Bacteroidia bacterium]|nr:hypothetical protein [Bacteroidia bacterium]
MKKAMCILIFLSGSLIRPAFGQIEPVDSSYAIADTQNIKIALFDNDELFDISLKFDITDYQRKRSDKEYLDALLTYYISDTDSITKKIKVKARGEFRRTLCVFPPLLLNFKMNDSVGGEFAGIDKLKLVPYCKIGYEDYVLREYLTYKLYNALTDNSLRVKLLRITYINTFKKSKPLTQYGFALEPIKLLEKRTNSVEVKSIHLTQKNIKPEMMDRFAIFNYMIGNTDWSVPIMHNALVLSQGGSDRPDLGIIVPFDFDYSGLVNADYAVPFESLPIKTVRERYYLGICRSEEVFLNALKEFSDKKEEFYRIINEFPYLGEKSKKDMILYLDRFYTGFDKRNSIVYNLRKTCIDL